MNYSTKTSKQTQERRYHDLVADVTNHPHKDELINIMYQQVLDEQDNLGFST